jgi:tape measure domain-containing protein
MASVAALNVRIGGDIKALEKALKDAERAVRTAGTRLSAIGNELSMKLTLPILAFGAAAIKSAGEIEAIEKAMQATFQGAGRSIEEANAELVALRKAAEAPGLDFEQAVKASLRLQGVGFSAEKARNTIIQLANAISTTGGTAENLNGVTVQFAQIISKGKILTSDLNVIKENMPGLAKIMKETFGTTSAEDLRALGVSGQEFVEKITAAMQKLPRVEGGISNAIVNAGVAVKTFLANVGESLNKTFNVTGKLEAFSKFLTDLGEKFSGMSEGTQRAIAAVGVFALALGPMLKVGQFAVLAIGQMIAVFGTLQKVLLQSLAGQAIPGAIAAFKALNLATKLTIVGAAIGVVLALAAAYFTLSKDTSAAAQSQEDLAEISKQSTEAISKEKVSTGLLVDVLKSNTTSLEQKKAALEKLNQIAPEYFKGLNAEKVNIDKLNEGYAAYIDNLLRAARAKAAEEKLIKIDQERMELAEKTARMMDRKPDNRFQNVGLGQNSNIAAQAESTRKEILNGYAEEEKALRFREDALKAQIITNTDFATTTKKASGAISDNAAASDESAKALKKREKAWEDLMVAVHKADLQEKEARGTLEYQDIKAGNKPVDKIGTLKTPDVIDPKFAERFEAGMQRVKNAAADAGKSIQGVAESIDVSLQRWADGLEKKLGEWPDRAKEGIQAIAGLSDAISARNISNLNKEMEERLKGVKKGSALEAKIKEEFQAKIDAMERKAARRAKVLAIMEATITAAQGVLKGLAKGSIPGAVAAGAIGAIQIARIIATPLAKGGIASGPVHALVGEYPGAANNPEVIAPLDKLRGMLGGASSDVNVSGTFRVQGTDLLLVLEKAQRQRGRANGF